MPRGNQLARQWQLLQLIDHPTGIAVEDAARKLDCTVRTIWRDLEVLERAGFPLYSDKEADGRRSIWKLQEDFKHGLPVKLSLAETAALVMSRDLLGPAGAGALGTAVTSAFEKIGRVHVALIQEALLERRRLDMRYYSMSRDEENRRQVDPYHLTVFDGGFYLIGYCHLRKAERIFAVERIRELKALTVDPPKVFDPSKYLQDAWGIIKGERVTVKIVFSKTIARYIQDRQWHPSQSFRDLAGGRMEMTLLVADTLEIRRWALGYGPEAEVVMPASLREAIREQADELARRLAPARMPLARMEGEAIQHRAKGRSARVVRPA